MQDYNTNEIVQGILKNDRKVLQYLYKKLRPQILAYITNNGGSEQDAEDILQDGIIAFFTNVRNGKYEAQSNTQVTTYIHQVCKFRWLDQLKSARRKTTVKMEVVKEDNYSEDPVYFQEAERIEKVSKVEKMFAQLGDKCKKLLTLFYYEKKKMTEINEIMNFSGNTSKNEKYRCMKKLRSLYSGDAAS